MTKNEEVIIVVCNRHSYSEFSKRNVYGSSIYNLKLLVINHHNQSINWWCILFLNVGYQWSSVNYLKSCRYVNLGISGLVSLVQITFHHKNRKMLAIYSYEHIVHVDTLVNVGEKSELKINLIRVSCEETVNNVITKLIFIS